MTNKRLALALIAFVPVAIVFFVYFGMAQSPPSQDTPKNELPMYGGVAKTSEEKKADAEFIAKAIAIKGTKEKASAHLILRGWEYLKNHQPQDAMKRFNQAWLLTPNNPHVFWGFGATLGEERNFQESVVMLEKAHTSLPKEQRLTVDLARTLSFGALNIEEKLPGKSIAKQWRDKSEILFKEAESQKPSGDLYLQWAFASYYRQDYATSWQKIIEARRLNAVVPDGFLADLRSKMPEPLDQKTQTSSALK